MRTFFAPATPARGRNLHGVATLSVALLAGLAPACSGDPSGSPVSEPAGEGRILAVGDSVVFGWDPLLETDPARVEPGNYEGFAEMLGARRGAAVDNASCPGEASGSFVDPMATDNGCDSNRSAYGLHLDWGANATQLGFLSSYLDEHVAAGTAPDVILLNVGGNDLLLLQNECGPDASASCMLDLFPTYRAGYGEHLRQILETIASADYEGTVVLLTQYAPDYADFLATFGLSQLGEVVAEVAADPPAGVRVVLADGYASFQEASEEFGKSACDAGLLIPMPDGGCDIHPSPEGDALLADTIEAALER